MAYLPEQAFDYVKNAHRQNRLGHAYLIVGDRGSGKIPLAERIATLLLLGEHRPACPLEELQSQGARVLRPESKSRIITIDAVRSFEQWLYLRDDYAARIGIIDQAHCMNESAANAFLKTLEEPPPSVHLLLLTDQPQMLLPTIRSRCITLPIHTGSRHAITPESPAWREIPPDTLPKLGQIAQKYIDDRHARPQDTIAAALGLQAKISQMLEQLRAKLEEQQQNLHKEEKTRYGQTTDSTQWLKAREAYHGGQARSHYLLWRQILLQTLLAWLGDALKIHSHAEAQLDIPDWTPTTQALAELDLPHELIARTDALNHLCDLLHTNVNENLALEAGFLQAFG